MHDQRYPRWVTILVVAAVAIAGMGLAPEGAVAKKRRGRRSNAAAARAAQRRAIEKSIQATRAQVEAAKRVGTAAALRAQAEQGTVQAAEQRAEAALRAIEKARSDARATTETLRQIESRIEAAQGPDSEFARARAALEKAEEAFRAARDRVLHSAEYKARYAEALKSPDKTLLAQVRSEALKHDADFQTASRDHEAAEREFRRIRRELFAKDPEWVAAAQAAREARAELTRAEQALSAAMLKRAGGRSRLRQEASTAAAARAVVEQGEGVINRLESSRKRLAAPKKKNYRRR